MELRAMTNSEGKRDGAVMMSSKMLSAQNSAPARCSYWQKREARSIDRGYPDRPVSSRSTPFA
jgi:hypothetical protein